MEDKIFSIYTDNYNPSLEMNNSNNNSKEQNNQIMVTPLKNSNLSNINNSQNIIDTKKNFNLLESGETTDSTNSFSDNDDSDNHFINLYNNINNTNNGKRKFEIDINNVSTNNFTKDDQPKKIKKLETKWPENLENAFIESVNLIPKKKIRNIKICGSTYGRNQFISFYIKNKTGILRTSKQISSHIQAITTSKKNPELTLLLKNGPGESIEICRKFEKIFTEILKNLPPEPEKIINNSKNKIDFNNNINNSKANSLNKFKPNNIYHSKPFKNFIRILFKKFEMSYINFESIKESHMFSTLDHKFINSDLPEFSISKSLLIQNFPFILNFINKSFEMYDHDILFKVPIIYGNISITLPPLINDLSTGCYNLTTKIGLSCLPKEEKNYAIISLITSNNFKIQEKFEIMNLASNKSKNDVIFTIKIGNDYWKNYVLNKKKEMTYNGINNICNREETFEMQINSIKIQQFIIHYDENFLKLNNGIIKLEQLNPLEIRSILIWNYSKVIDQSKAITTLRRVTSIFNDNELINSLTPMKNIQYGKDYLNENLIQDSQKDSYFTPPKSNRKNPFYNEENNDTILPKSGMFFKTQSTPNMRHQQLDQSGLVSHIFKAFNSSKNINNMLNNADNNSNNNRNLEMNNFDFPTNVSIGQDTSEFSEFTSNIIDNTASTSFSTIEEVDTDLEKNQENNDNLSTQPIQMSRSKNNSSTIAQILSFGKDDQESSYEIIDGTNNNNNNTNNNNIDQRQVQQNQQDDKIEHLETFNDGDESLIFSNSTESGFDPLFMDYNNLVFGNINFNNNNNNNNNKTTKQ